MERGVDGADGTWPCFGKCRAPSPPHPNPLPKGKGAGCQPGGTAGVLTFVLGGARSGKSRYAEGVLTAAPSPWTYIATAQAFDAEMRARIAQHREERVPGWQTVEAPVEMPAALAAAGAAPVLVDCLTLWLSNLMLGDHYRPAAAAALLEALDGRTAPTVLVSNEVGFGIVPGNAIARAFRDEAGRLHQQVAARADRVVLVVAGLPIAVKGTL